MLLLTPELEETLSWFYSTHELEIAEGKPATWRRSALPGAGGLGDQDNRLMASLDVIRTTFNDRLIKRWASKRRQK